jgi:hypothetical protein
LLFGELMSRGEKARRIFRQLERVVRAQNDRARKTAGQIGKLKMRLAC